MSATYEPHNALTGSLGLLAPSPNEWHLSPLTSRIFATGAILIVSVGTIFLNNRYNVLQTPALLFASLFLILCGANPWITSYFGSSIILAFANLVCLYVLFSLYGRRNAAQGTFIIFSTLSWVSMIQYAGVTLMPVYVIGLIFLNVFRLKELIAIVMGIAAPWCIVFGLDLAAPSQFHWSSMSNLLNGFTSPDDLFWLLTQVGATAFIFVMTTLYCTLHSSASGLNQRARRSFINLLGVALICFMLVDAPNMLAYAASLNLCTGLQLTRLFTLGKIHPPYLLLVVPLIVYTALYAATLIF